MKKCLNCGNNMDIDALFCSQCGNKNPNVIKNKISTTNSKSLNLFKIGVVLVLFFIFIISNFMDNKSKETNVIIEPNVTELNATIETEEIIMEKNIVTQGNLQDNEIKAVQALINLHGYKCDSVNFAMRSPWDGDIEVTCNDYAYSYEVEDKGGNWVVTLD